MYVMYPFLPLLISLTILQPRVYDVVNNYGQAFGSNLDWHYPTDQSKAIVA